MARDRREGLRTGYALPMDLPTSARQAAAYSAAATWSPQRGAPSLTDRRVGKYSGLAPRQCSSHRGREDVAWVKRTATTLDCEAGRPQVIGSRHTSPEYTPSAPWPSAV